MRNEINVRLAQAKAHPIKQLLRKSGVPQYQFALALGWSETKTWRKLAGYLPFTAEEEQRAYRLISGDVSRAAETNDRNVQKYGDVCQDQQIHADRVAS
ncbi:hypothetical protein [Solidesulfovibrio magneticus]|uniref:hypothetical protein n=1 Tax=Solidesulfovibrio magneticus TaxID=184917 RepID=UPI0005BAB587|nr:hypothetical protein [Solidesulfovibrio magneticus]